MTLYQFHAKDVEMCIGGMPLPAGEGLFVKVATADAPECPPAAVVTLKRRKRGVPLRTWVSGTVVTRLGTRHEMSLYFVVRPRWWTRLLFWRSK